MYRYFLRSSFTHEKKLVHYFTQPFLRYLYPHLAVYALYYTRSSVRHLNVEYTPTFTEESAQSLDNPYRGFYRMSGYILSDGQKPSKAASWCKKSCKDNPYPLMLLEINLKNYSNTSISTNALKQLNKILNECTRAKKQVVLRFLYDWDGQALSSEPSDLSQIKKHISQLSSTVNSYADCIYILQGALIGNNGEMNNSNYNDINQIRQIIEELDQNIVPDIYLAVRTPGSASRCSSYQKSPFKYECMARHPGITSGTF